MERNRKIIQVSTVGIVANVLLAAFKAAVGFMSGAIAIVMDGVNNLSDALSSVITIVGTKLSAKPADREHPFGHGRAENMTARKIHLLTRSLSATLYKEFGVIMTIGIYALYTGDTPMAHLQDDVLRTASSQPGVLQTHAFYYYEDQNLITIDVVPDESVHDDQAFSDTIVELLTRSFPDYRFSIVVDHNYS